MTATAEPDVLAEAERTAAADLLIQAPPVPSQAQVLPAPKTTVDLADRLMLEQARLPNRIQRAKRQTDPQAIERALATIAADASRWPTEWVQLQNRSPIAAGCALYWIEKSWEDLTPLAAAHASFEEFATMSTGVEYSTWRQWVALYRFYELNESKNPWIDENKLALRDVPTGKKQKAMGPMRAGRMKAFHYAALLDATVSDQAFYLLLKQATDEEHEAEEERFVEEGNDTTGMDHLPVVWEPDTGKLTAWRGKFGVTLGWLEPKKDDQEVADTVAWILTAAGIKAR